MTAAALQKKGCGVHRYSSFSVPIKKGSVYVAHYFFIGKFFPSAAVRPISGRRMNERKLTSCRREQFAANREERGVKG